MRLLLEPRKGQGREYGAMPLVTLRVITVQVNVRCKLTIHIDIQSLQLN